MVVFEFPGAILVAEPRNCSKWSFPILLGPFSGLSPKWLQMYVLDSPGVIFRAELKSFKITVFEPSEALSSGLRPTIIPDNSLRASRSHFPGWAKNCSVACLLANSFASSNASNRNRKFQRWNKVANLNTKTSEQLRLRSRNNSV